MELTLQQRNTVLLLALASLSPSYSTGGPGWPA